jgi:protein SCO1/2
MTAGRTLAAALAAILAVAVTAGCGSSAPAQAPQNTGLVHIKVSAYRGRIVTPAKPKPGFVLTGVSGQPYDFRAMTAGMVTLLFFGYTHCPDECPLTAANTAAAMRDLSPAQQARVRFVFVTVDPARDTGPVLRRWLDRFDPAFIGLTGTLGAVQAAASEAGIPVGKPIRQPDGSYQLDHGTEMLAFSTDNRAHLAFFPSTSSADMAHDLKLLIVGHHP